MKLQAIIQGVEFDTSTGFYILSVRFSQDGDVLYRSRIPVDADALEVIAVLDLAWDTYRAHREAPVEPPIVIEYPEPAPGYQHPTDGPKVIQGDS